MLEFLFTHKIFLIPIISLLVAQATKFIVLTIKSGLNWNNVFEPGNFPSAHSAFVTSLVICVGTYSRNNSHSSEFAIAMCFAFITIYDAMRVRMHIGLQGKAFNELIEELKMDKEQFPHMKEHVGHYANEVVGGILIGIALSLVMIKFFEVVI